MKWVTKSKNLSYFVHDIGQGFTTQGISIVQTIQRYPRDSIRNILPIIKDTPKVQDQDILVRPRPPTKQDKNQDQLSLQDQDICQDQDTIMYCYIPHIGGWIIMTSLYHTVQ